MDFLVKNLRFLSVHPEYQRGQHAAGEAAGVGQPAISKIIAGKTQEPGYRTVMKLAKHYGVSVDDLLNRDIESTGVGKASQPARLDAGKLANLIEAVEQAADYEGLNLPPRFKARVVAALFLRGSGQPLTGDAIRAALSAVMSSLEE